jgi:hypothetical protein
MTIVKNAQKYPLCPQGPASGRLVFLVFWGEDLLSLIGEHSASL